MWPRCYGAAYINRKERSRLKKNGALAALQDPQEKMGTPAEGLDAGQVLPFDTIPAGPKSVVQEEVEAVPDCNIS
jgi:hypothetical protein